MAMKEGRTTVQIDREIMQEVKRRAVENDEKYSEYLERIILEAWSRERGKSGNKPRSGK